MPRLTILPDNVTVDVAAGSSLLEAALKANVDILHSCGGKAACTTCRVIVREGGENVSPIGRSEEELLRESGILRTHRLSCQARVSGDVVFERRRWEPVRGGL